MTTCSVLIKFTEAYYKVPFSDLDEGITGHLHELIINFLSNHIFLGTSLIVVVD